MYNRPMQLDCDIQTSRITKAHHAWQFKRLIKFGFVVSGIDRDLEKVLIVLILLN